MVWAGISGHGKTKLHFCVRKSPTARNPNRLVNVKVDAEYYQEILVKRAWPDGKRIFGRKRFVPSAQCCQKFGNVSDTGSSKMVLLHRALTRLSHWPEESSEDESGIRGSGRLILPT